MTTGHPAAPRPRTEQEIARDWLANVYQGDRTKQLTVRAVVTGMLLGGMMCLSNLYVGLKTGWGLGVTITSCILAYAIFTGAQRLFPRLRADHFTILENNAMSSAASAAGYMSSGGFVAAIPALLLTTGMTLTWYQMMLWSAAMSFLGVALAVPMKRQMINIDQLPFPSGIATAETLRAMHTKGAEAVKKARALAGGAGVGALVAWLREGGLPGRPTWWRLPGALPDADTTLRLLGLKMGAAGSTIGLELSLIMVGAGAIIGIRVGLSMLIGAVGYYGLVAPRLLELGIVAGTGYRKLVAWSLWPGAAIMVSSGLLSFFLKWRTIVRSFSGLTRLFGGARPAEDDPLAEIEVPSSWFVWGFSLAGLACVVLGVLWFGISWWMGVIAVLMTLLLSIVASRATGETDITPTGAMGKITQLMFGALAPGNMTVNLMTASITGGASIHTADLLTDLKSGYLLGANPRKQFWAQMFGVIAGTIFIVPAYTLIVRSPETLGSAEFPAPAAQVWAAVAKLLARGLDALPRGAVAAIVVAALLGAAITLVEELWPRARRFVPSATGLGIALVIPAFNSISMFLGAFLAWLLARRARAWADLYTVPVSSGFIAGESLTGLVVAVMRDVLKWIPA